MKRTQSRSFDCLPSPTRKKYLARASRLRCRGAWPIKAYDLGFYLVGAEGFEPPAFSCEGKAYVLVRDLCRDSSVPLGTREYLGIPVRCYAMCYASQAVKSPEHAAPCLDPRPSRP